jgi:response regulator RpfG family c-di-GMP phosphodiesterase
MMLSQTYSKRRLIEMPPNMSPPDSLDGNRGDQIVLTQGKQLGIMVVDDQPANLKLMEDMLRGQGYGVRSFRRGRMALAAAGEQPPDLILLDINMPEMNGFEVCELLKADKKLASIPVIFLSALNETDDKVKAFRCGGVDYITKPFQFEKVQARVETHLRLQRALRAERDLLENTLNGAVRALSGLVQLSGPALTARSEAIKAIVAHIATRSGVAERWQYDLAAMLCLIGCTSLPVEVFERAYAGETMSEEEDQMFRNHPESGARLLTNIPRLENVAEMIRRQQTADGTSASGVAERGACMLRVAVELDKRMVLEVPFKTALDQLRVILRTLPRDLLDALRDYVPPKTAFEIKRLHVHELRVSMILEDDVVTKDGAFMILQKGTTLNLTLVERIGNFAKSRGICQPIRVRVVQADNAIPASSDKPKQERIS